MAAFTNEEAAESYVEESEGISNEKLPNDSLVWIGYDATQLQDSYG